MTENKDGFPFEKRYYLLPDQIKGSMTLLGILSNLASHATTYEESGGKNYADGSYAGQKSRELQAFLKTPKGVVYAWVLKNNMVRRDVETYQDFGISGAVIRSVADKKSIGIGAD